MYQSYSITRFVGDDAEHGTTFTIADDDAINCAHMLAAGFNTISRNMLGDFVLAVVDKKAGVVQYDGKAEMINRLEPSGPYSQSFTFEASTVDADTLLTFFGIDEKTTVTAAGKFTFAEESKYAHIDRDVLEAAYGELEDVKAALETVGVETIPASKGVRTLIRRLDHEEHARHAYEEANGQANEFARAELIEHVKRAYAKWSEIDPGRTNSGVKSNLRGMIEVLSKFLVAIGEADADERHAVALRVCGIPEGNYLYDDA